MGEPMTQANTEREGEKHDEVQAIEAFASDEDRFDSPDLEELAGKQDTPLWKHIVFPVYWEEEDGEDMSEVAKAQLGEIVSRGTDLSAVVVADCGDSDGRGAAGLYTSRFGEDMVHVPANHRGNNVNPLDILNAVSDVIAPGVMVFVADLGPNADEAGAYQEVFRRLTERNPVFVRDHHEWSRESREAIGGMVSDLKIDHDRCATEIVHDSDLENPPEHLTNLARLTSIRDLWKDNHKDFEDTELLANAAFNLDFGEYEQLVARVGPNLMDDEQMGERLMEMKQEKEIRIQTIVETAKWSELGGYTVAFAYGNGYSSGIGAELIEQGAEIAVIANTSGGISLRAAEETPVAASIAERLGGGGHPCAAGCRPIELGSGGDFSYRKLWGSLGVPVHMAVAEEISQYGDENSG